MNFNPRPPRGGRPGGLVGGMLLLLISIHAPLAGGDPSRQQYLHGVLNFNPRPPRGGRHVPPVYQREDWQFQSTPPSRGATLQRHMCGGEKEISIHAPLAGGDFLTKKWWTIIIRFQSTPPSRGATCEKSSERQKFCNFNPRPPRGGRHGVASTFPGETPDFNPRPPRGGRLGEFKDEYNTLYISIHAPLAGGDALISLSTSITFPISIHAPLAGGDWPSLVSFRLISISIHAPLAGGDLAQRRIVTLLQLFQSTPPSRGATHSFMMSE